MFATYVLHFCTRCGITTDHMQYTQLEEDLFCCMICQNDETISNMYKTYKALIIHDRDFQCKKRRKLTAIIRRTSVPNRVGETKTLVENIEVQYYAYGRQHYTAALSLYPNDGQVNHLEAKAISNELQKMLSAYRPPV